MQEEEEDTNDLRTENLTEILVDRNFNSISVQGCLYTTLYGRNTDVIAV